MNRIILIGNGFDLAHGLQTRYTDFIDWYWTELTKKFNEDHAEDIYSLSDDFVELTADSSPERSGTVVWLSQTKVLGSQDLIALLDDDKAIRIEENSKALKLMCKNKFWKHISKKPSLQSWLDIENEYYTELKSHLKLEPIARNAEVKKLNKEFCQVKNLLEKYLTEVCKNSEFEPIQGIKADIIYARIKYEDVAIAKRQAFLDSIPDEKNRLRLMVQNAPPQFNHLRRMGEQQLNGEIEQSINNAGVDVSHTLLLNFNYTDTAEKLFGKPDDECDYEDYRGVKRPPMDIINIHGELNNDDNPIIFGYGDELDDDYREIEKTNDNDFLENIKSIHYHSTNNYRRLLDFLQDDPFQVFILGHSCGNSDRTLLNTIFEHENCISIKQFYYQFKDEKTGEVKDNHTEITKNIYRNFNNKQNLRDIVVSRDRCEPLVPYNAEQSS
jgi:hypothetical protein